MFESPSLINSRVFKLRFDSSKEISQKSRNRVTKTESIEEYSQNSLIQEISDMEVSQVSRLIDLFPWSYRRAKHTGEQRTITVASGGTFSVILKTRGKLCPPRERVVFSFNV